MLDDPVPASFRRRKTLPTTIPNDSASDTLPHRTATVATPLRDPSAPCAVLHRTVVSDSHVLRSHPLPVTRTDPQNVTSPSPEPATVTLTDPVLAAFEGNTLLADIRSADHAKDKLLTRPPAVTDARLDPDTPPNVRHRSAVSASHVVRSHPL